MRAPAMAAIFSNKKSGIDIFLLAGSLIWVVGYTVEVVADLQKYHFKSQPENSEKFIDSGLWSISRHPNYLGEITLWTGIALIALPTLSGWQYFTLSSPVFIFCLLNYISGIPLLEKSADKCWGHLKAYQQYKQSTPRLVPALRKFRIS